MGYEPPTPEQWTREDLDRANAAGDHAAIVEARKAGALRDLLAPAEPEPAEPAEPEVPAGPTVPGLVPGGSHTYGSGAQMDRRELDALVKAGDHAAIVEARRAGRLQRLMGA